MFRPFPNRRLAAPRLALKAATTRRVHCRELTRPHPILRLLLALTLGCLPRAVANAADLHGLRVLKENCFGCHNAKKQKGGLALDSHSGLMTGGDTGAVVDLKSPGDSEVLKLLAADADPHMPPKKQLSDAEIEAVRNWIKAGAKWNADALAGETNRSVRWQPLAAAYRPVIAVAAAGERFAAGSGNRVLVFKTGEKEPEKLFELTGHRDVVQSLAFSQNGETLVSGGFRRVIVWDVKSGKRRHGITNGLTGRVTALTFVAGDKFIVAGDSLATRAGRLVAFDADKPTVRKTIAAHADSVYSLAASRDGKSFVSTSADKLAKIWRVDGWKPLGTLEGHTDYVLAADFNPAGDRIVTASADAKIKVWEVKTRKQISEFPTGTTKPVTGIFWTLDPGKEKPDEKDDWIVAVAEDGRPRLFTQLVLHDGQQRSTGAKVRTWTDLGKGLTALAFAKDSGRIVTGDVGGGIGVWDLKGKLLKRLE